MKRVFNFSMCILFMFTLSIGLKANNIKEINEMLIDQKIPGFTLIYSNKDGEDIKCYGYSDLENKIKVDTNTLFDLGILGELVNDLILLELENKQKLDLNDDISNYLSEFKGMNIKVEDLINHRSGISYNNILLKEKKEIKNYIIKIMDNKQNENVFEYSNLNIVLSSILIEKIVNKNYKTYIIEFLNSIELYNTKYEINSSKENIAKGYKLTFYQDKEYNFDKNKYEYYPQFMKTNSGDVLKLTNYLLGKTKIENKSFFSKVSKLIPEDMKIDENYIYKNGFYILPGFFKNYINYDLNPNFSSYIAFSIEKQEAVVLLSNSNRLDFRNIGDSFYKKVTNTKKDLGMKELKETDKNITLGMIIFILFLLVNLGYLINLIVEIIKRKRKYKKINKKSLLLIIFSGVVFLGIVYLLNNIPVLLEKSNWESITIWYTGIFILTILIIIASFLVLFINIIIALLFQHRNKYIQVFPGLVLLGIFSGISNMALILMVTRSLTTEVNLKLVLIFYAIALFIFVLGKNVSERHLTKITNSLISKLRVRLFGKILTTSYRNFENLDKGKVYSTINNDTMVIGSFASSVAGLFNTIVVIIFVFVYFILISWKASLFSFILISLIIVIYQNMASKMKKLWDEARESQNIFMRYLDAIVKGLKDLIIHNKKLKEFNNDFEEVCEVYESKNNKAAINFINLGSFIDVMFIVLLGFVAFYYPIMFKSMPKKVLISLLMIFMYLMGPIFKLVNMLPKYMHVKIAWEKIKSFEDELIKNKDFNNLSGVIEDKKTIESLSIQDITFKYNNKLEREDFAIGPINLELKKGEIIFIIGGNGSGKTTFAKLITGLYKPSSGKILIDGLEVEKERIGEYMSIIFSDFYLFEKLYAIKTEGKEKEIEEYLKLLEMEDKVSIKDGKFTNVNLSTGQRKRLALLKCYIEDKPIYLFDEWAADQDPEYRKFFYNELLPKMREEGKIVIAITHDDHYFGVADKIIKLDMGKVDFYREDSNK